MNILEQAAEAIHRHYAEKWLSVISDGAAQELVDDLEAAGLLRSDPPDEGEIMSFRTTGNNSHIIEDCFKLGYLTDDMAILDPTYGKGVFWKRHRPPFLIGTDLDPAKSPGGRKPSACVGGTDQLFPDQSIDFTNMPIWRDAEFDAVVFDPDYKLQGTDSGNGPASSNERYGMARGYRTVATQLGIIYDGLAECVRVVKPGGVVAVKHMDQVVSGSVTWQSDNIVAAMWKHNCEKFAAFHLEGHRKQPTHDKCRGCDQMGYYFDHDTNEKRTCEKCGGERKIPRRQVHERRNYSTLALFRKAKT